MEKYSRSGSMSAMSYSGRMAIGDRGCKHLSKAVWAKLSIIDLGIRYSR